MNNAEIIKRIDELKKEVDKLRPLQPEQKERLLQKIRLDWSFHSNHIEGNTLTYGETKALLLWGVTAKGKPLRDHLEIKGHNEAVKYILDIIDGKEIDLTEHFIRQLHKLIIPEEYYLEARTAEGMATRRKITSGQYKKTPNHVITKTGEVFYFASPEETPAKMMDLMNWYKKETDEKQDHPLIISSVFHYRFVRIHPFDDGNGRMARLLMNFILMKHGYPPLIINTGLRDEYLQSLQYADAEDINQLLGFLGQRLLESLELWLRAVKGENIEEDVDGDSLVRIINNKVSEG